MVDTKPSKSARKRDFIALQELGEQLIALNPAELDAIDLDPQLLQAVLAAQNIHSRSALRRQKQLIGRIMRGIDSSPVRAALALREQQERPAKALFRRAESWRDRITAEGQSALTEFFAETGRRSNALVEALEVYDAAGSDGARKHIRRRIFRQVHGELAAMSDEAGH